MRLQSFDYSTEGMYFVTICVQNKKSIFGDISDGAMTLNVAGKMIDNWWQKLPDKFDNIKIDEYCIMPNHFHGIINIVGVRLCARPDNDKYKDNGPIRRTRGSAPTLSTIIQWFKTMSTNEYIHNVKTNNWPSFDKHLWQRSYYEHIIRNETDLLKIQEYIQSNPNNWEKDENYVEKKEISYAT